MEEKILKALEYKLTYPTSFTFLKRFLKGSCHDDGYLDDDDPTMEKLTCMILDSTLLYFHNACSKYLPSQLAAGAIVLARHALLCCCPTTNHHHHHDKNVLWNPTYESLSTYSEDEAIQVATDIYDCYRKAIAHTTLRSLEKKYSKTKYGKVSSIPVQSMDSYLAGRAGRNGSGN
jgi:hypothetical protein